MPIKAANNEYMNPDTLASAIRWAADHGADVISVSQSWADDYSSLTSAINYAVSNGRSGKGCVVVFGSGDDNGGVRFPARLDNVIAVGATNESDGRATSSDWGSGCGGSCYGSQLDIVAPGNNIWTTDISGSAGRNNALGSSCPTDPTSETSANLNYTSNFGGTSASAPLVAGLAALVLSKDPGLTYSEVKKIIEQTAERVAGMSGQDFTYEYSWGRLNAWNALRITTSGSLPGNEVWHGNVSLTGNDTISGVFKLTILSGTSVSLNGHSITSASGRIYVESGVTISGAVLVQSGSTIVGIYPSLQSALSAATNGQTVSPPTGTYTISAEATVASGVTLQTGTATTFNFTSAYKLVINGKLVANGTTFTRSGGQWVGIEFNYGNSGSSLSYVTIENAQIGLSLTGTSPSVSNCIFQNNTTGVYASNTYSTFLWTLIYNNSTGFNLTYYGDPTISHNILRYNGYAVDGDGTSVPTMGGISGSNSFIYTDYYDVRTTYSGTINAESNWWYPWAPSFSGNVDYSNYLDSDPNLWARMLPAPPVRPVLPPMLAKIGGMTTDSIGMSELDQAYQLLVDGKQDQALSAFQSIARNYPDAFAGERALAFADHLLEKTGRDAKQNLASAIAQHPNSGVGILAKSLLTGHLVKAGSYKEAFDNAVSLVGNPDKMISKRALYDAGSIAWYRQVDKTTGEKYLRQLIAEFPGDPLSLSALSTLRDWSGNTPERQAIAQTGSTDASFGLENYPNPFNPTTVVRFNLRAEGQVHLRVFDMLGREVAELVNGFLTAGEHQVTFDASNLASGMYLCSLEAGGKTSIRKLLLVR